MPPKPEPAKQNQNWTPRDSAELYGLERWGAGFFDVNPNGRIEVLHRRSGQGIDLLELVRDVERRDLHTPLLLRFSDILAGRIEQLTDAFRTAMNHYGYDGSFRGVYPVKVNQQRQVVEEVVEFGRPHSIGLEAGSKPELLIALAILDNPDAYIICNGFKDRAYVELALLAQHLGRTPLLVIDRLSELELAIDTARSLNIRPHLGLRARLTSRGAGRWLESTGERSKFGLTASEMVTAVERLQEHDMVDCLKLVHFHIGSQITEIRALKEALTEGSRTFVGLHELGAKPHLVDVGGGLAVDYDGTQTNFHSSKNYSMQEYANDVVSFIQEACDESNIAHPDIITEAGRAMVAHHSVLIFDVLGVDVVPGETEVEPIEEEAPKILHDLTEVLATADDGKFHEAWHDAVQLKEEAGALFSLGYLDLRDRARAERLFWRCCAKVQKIVRTLDHIPEGFEELERAMADTYYGNLSVFQSAPDHWAVKQLFPVMPIHRLDEKPDRRGVFADLTCDSDGKIDRFIDQRDGKHALELHALDDNPYYIGVFLVGAYQEILGDLHNLFGDTDAVHVRLNGNGDYTIDQVIEGDSVRDVLRYVQYDQKTLLEQVRTCSENAVRRGLMSLDESTRLRRRYEQGLREYTYLCRDH
ncbi:biosynthetic arginine decarboxylase [Myxococcota bacterium]|nr:biosynthetic arginine decarboxylase [Myxococcota bacterium]